VLTGSIAQPGGKVADHVITIRYEMKTPEFPMLRSGYIFYRLRTAIIIKETYLIF
jgi:hypothetical protein